MPTAARLIAAFAFGAVAFFAANGFIPLMPDGVQLGWFIPVSVLVGMWSGWSVMGRLAGRGYSASAGSGVRTSLNLVFWCLVIFSLTEMIENSIRLRYEGPAQAIIAAFGLALDNLRLMLVPDIVAILVIGGILAGMLVEWTAARWS